MPKKPEIKHPLHKVRDALGESQPEFARRLGVSASILKKIETGKREFSPDFASRMFAETGLIMIREPIDESFTYTKGQHQEWKSQTPFNGKMAELCGQQLAKWTEIMLSAASRPGVQKGYPVFNALVRAMERVKDEFRLEKHINAELIDRNSAETRVYTVRELRADERLANQLGFKDKPGLKDEDTVPLKKPRGWIPSNEVLNVWNQHRELIEKTLRHPDIVLSPEERTKLEEMQAQVDTVIDRVMIPRPAPGQR